MAGKRESGARSSKPPLGRRVGENLNALGSLGRTAVERPRELPRHAEGMFRRWFRQVWSVRGGGLYATGFALTFLYIEIVDIVTDDIPTLFSINLLSGELVGFIIEFFIDTFLNFVEALIWPIEVIAFAPPWGVVGLVVAWFVFDRFLTSRIEEWMERGDVVVSDPSSDAPP